MKYLIFIGIVAALGLAYWLAAPLFIDKKVSEELPVVLTPEQAQQQITLTQGSFIGADNFHKAKGTAKILKIGDKQYVRFEEDFEVTNGPDLFVHFGNNGRYVKEANLGALKGNLGSQNYEIPADINSTDYNEIWIWCRAFSVAFGSAKLKNR